MGRVGRVRQVERSISEIGPTGGRGETPFTEMGETRRGVGLGNEIHVDIENPKETSKGY